MENCRICNKTFVLRTRGMEGTMVECAHCLTPFWRFRGKIIPVFTEEMEDHIKEFWETKKSSVSPCLGRKTTTTIMENEQYVFDSWLSNEEALKV